MARGEFMLTMNGTRRPLVAGGTCKVQRGMVHAEIYGPEGVTIWVARAN